MDTFLKRGCFSILDGRMLRGINCDSVHFLIGAKWRYGIATLEGKKEVEREVFSPYLDFFQLRSIEISMTKRDNMRVCIILTLDPYKLHPEPDFLHNFHP